MHGHLDVVPADPAEWSVHPFSGEERDGYVWGRGAVDMKDMDAMVLALVRDWARTGVRPPRDIVLAFVADEEAGGRLGARWLVDEHPDLFEGCTEAISEVGGFSITVRDDLRLYLVQTAEKGLAWMRLTAGGRPGHGSFVHDDNAVTRLCEAVARIGSARLPTVLTPPMRQFLDAVEDAYGIEIDPDEPEQALARLGSDQPDDRRGPAQHRQPDHARRRLQGQRHPRARRPPPSTAASSTASRRSSSGSSPR